jgi:hypothetical protein
MLFNKSDGKRKKYFGDWISFNRSHLSGKGNPE